MERVPSRPRPNAPERHAEAGFHHHAGYWVEDAYYSIPEHDARTLADSALTALAVLERSMSAVLKDSNRFRQLLSVEGLSHYMSDMIIYSWEQQKQGVCSRIRLGWNPDEGSPVLLGYKSGSALGMVEQAAQQAWGADLHPDEFQFANLDRAMSSALSVYEGIPVHVLFPLNDDTGEIVHNGAYWMGRALDAGVETKATLAETLSLQHSEGVLLDHNDEPVSVLYYPYRTRVLLANNPELSHAIIHDPDIVSFVEPLWRRLMSSTYTLAAAWAISPNHPNLTETRIGNPGDLYEDEAVVFPLSEAYQTMPVIQRKTPYKKFDDHAPEFDVWIVNGVASALMVREYTVGDPTPHVVPHLIER